MAGDASPPQQSSPSTLPSLTNPSPPESSPQTPPPPSPPPPSPLPPEDEDENSPPPPPVSTNNQQPPPQNQPLPINQPLLPPPVVPGGTQPRVPITPHRETPKVPNNKPVQQSSPADMQDSSSSSSSSSNGSSSSSSTSSNDHKILIAGLVAGSFVLLFLILICVVCITRKRRRNKSGGMPAYAWDQHGPTPQGNQYWKASPQDPGLKMYQTHPVYTNNYNDNNVLITGGMGSQSPMPGAAGSSMTLGFNKSSFSYEELASATNGFSQANMLGQGGFGYVHKGVLPNGKEIAVKRLKSGSGQGEREFQAEVDIISRVHHRHLVSLVGYCIAPDQRILVYEFVSNNNLEYHLHHPKGRRPPLDFSTRLGIALGSAKGLGYLHEDCHPRIIHRDIKASNILLDDNFEAMVADFGLAKLTSDTNTHVSTRVMGTFGYLAPEYASSGKLTEKSDVFSFGVMLLELITGRRPVDPDMKYMEDSLVDWARPLLTKALDSGNYDELADPELERNFNRYEMQRMVACAAASIRHSAKKRPKMSQIVRVLEGDVSLDDLNEGVKPGQSSIYGTSDGSDYDTRQYSADLKKFRRMAFSTQNFASSEYGGTTTEYALNPSDDMIQGRSLNST